MLYPKAIGPPGWQDSTMGSTSSKRQQQQQQPHEQQDRQEPLQKDEEEREEHPWVAIIDPGEPDVLKCCLCSVTRTRTRALWVVRTSESVVQTDAVTAHSIALQYASSAGRPLGLWCNFAPLPDLPWTGLDRFRERLSRALLDAMGVSHISVRVATM